MPPAPAVDERKCRSIESAVRAGKVGQVIGVRSPVRVTETVNVGREKVGLEDHLSGQKVRGEVESPAREVQAILDLTGHASLLPQSDAVAACLTA